MWVAVGSGENSIAYSYDGTRWFGLGTSVFTTGNGITWNGNQWVAVGLGTYSIFYSTNGINWSASSNGTNAIGIGFGVTRSNNIYVALGNQGSIGTSVIAWSGDGDTWQSISDSLFTTGRGVTSNGSVWVAVGNGTNTLAYSYSGKIWTANGATIFTTQANGVCWTGTRFVAVGTGTNTIAHSRDGITWYSSINGNNIFTQGNGVAGNSRIGSVVVDSQIVLNRSDTLSVVSDSYYNKGYTTFSATIQTQQLS